MGRPGKPTCTRTTGRMAASLGALVVLSSAAWVASAEAGVVNEEYLERKGMICEPRLLERRAAEHLGRKRRFFNALVRNSVWLRIGKSVCSGTFITPTCVLTAAHCLTSPTHSRNIVAANHLAELKGGRGIMDEHYAARRRDKKRKLTLGWVSGDDLGVVVFRRPFRPFKPIGLSYALGNLNAWFFEASKPDRHYKGDLGRFDTGHWQDFGTLGLTGFTSPAKRRPLSLCSDSMFEWAPCFIFVERRHRAPKIETGVLCHTGEMGPGMSGGSFYDERHVFGVLVEGPKPDKSDKINFIPIRNHWWYRHPRSFFSSNVTKGFANRAKLLMRSDRDFILKHCPKADLVLREPAQGLRVRDRSLAGKRGTNRYWLPGGHDVWRKLKLKDRMHRVNRRLREGNSGEFVRRLQVRLRQLKLYRGAVDGTYGASTTAAVRRFQSRNKLKPTGIADKQTLVELRIWFNKLN